MKKYFNLLTCIVFAVSLCFFCSSSPAKIEKLDKQTQDISNLEVPAYSAGDQIIRHTAYTLKYNEKYEQAEWVAYKLVPTKFDNAIKRKDSFREDHAVKTGSASPDDYNRSGYDRGHLAPAADMKYSALTMSESFLMSNISPQEPVFNRGIWKRLEAKVRSWAVQNEELYVVTGSLLNDDLKTIGKNRVGVPGFYFKVILDYKKPEYKAIAFVLTNSKSSLPLKSFVMSVNDLEKAIGIDFFPALPDTIEEKIESSADVTKWGF